MCQLYPADLFECLIFINTVGMLDKSRYTIHRTIHEQTQNEGTVLLERR